MCIIAMHAIKIVQEKGGGKWHSPEVAINSCF